MNIRREAISQDDPEKDNEVSTAVSMCYLIARQRIRLVKLAAEKGNETKANRAAQECNSSVAPKHPQPN